MNSFQNTQLALALTDWLNDVDPSVVVLVDDV